MRTLFLTGILFLFLSSCKKKEICSANTSDEVWLVIKDTNGTNLLDSLYTSTPSIIGGVGFHPERVIANNGTEDLTAWKIDLDGVPSGGTYQLSSEPIPGDVVQSGNNGENFYFEIEFKIEPKKIEGCRKKYTKGRLVWMRVNESVFYGSGVHTYLEN